MNHVYWKITNNGKYSPIFIERDYYTFACHILVIATERKRVELDQNTSYFEGSERVGYLGLS